MDERVQVCVVVYNRMHTLRRWMQAWNLSDKQGASLAVIHNFDGDNPPPTQQRAILACHPDTYIPRKNVGRDIGAFQDLIRNRLPGLPPWDILCWFTDDFIPMRRDFLKFFTTKFSDPAVALVGACHEQKSERFREHFRTVGFALRKSVAESLQFIEDPIQTDRAIYEFEHGMSNMTLQVRGLGHKAIPAFGEPLPSKAYSHWLCNSTFMWDCIYLAEKNLWRHFDEVFSTDVVPSLTEEDTIEYRI